MTQTSLEKVCGILDATLADFIRKALDNQRTADAAEYDFQLRDATACINTLNSSTDSFAHYDGKLLPYLYALFYHIQRSAEVFEILKHLLSGTQLRMPTDGPLEIIDLGHGTGATTTALRCLSAVHPELFQRPDRAFPAVHVYGVDSSVEMLEFAQSFDQLLEKELRTSVGPPNTPIKSMLALEYRCWTRGCPQKLRKSKRPCLLLGHYLADRPSADYATAFAKRLYRVLCAEQAHQAVMTSSESKLQRLGNALGAFFANESSQQTAAVRGTAGLPKISAPHLPLFVVDSSHEYVAATVGVTTQNVQLLADSIRAELQEQGTNVSKSVVSWRSYGNPMIAIRVTNAERLQQHAGQELSRSTWLYSTDLLGKAGTTFDDVSAYFRNNPNSNRIVRLNGSAGTGKSLIAFHLLAERIHSSISGKTLLDRSEHVHSYITFEPALAENIYDRLSSYSREQKWGIEEEQVILGSESRARLLCVRASDGDSTKRCRLVISTWDSFPSLILGNVQNQDALSARLRSDLASIGRYVSDIELSDCIRTFDVSRILRHGVLFSTSLQAMERPAIASAYQDSVHELSKYCDSPLSALFHKDVVASSLVGASSSTWIFDEAQDLCPIRAAWIKDVLCKNAGDQVVVIASDTAQQIRGKSENPKHIVAITKNRKRATLTECFRTSRNIWRVIQCLRLSNPHDDAENEQGLSEGEDSLLGCPVGPRVRVIARDSHSQAGDLAGLYVTHRMGSGFQNEQWRCGDGSKRSSKILQRVSTKVGAALRYKTDALSYTTLKDVRGQEYPNVLWASDAMVQGEVEGVDMETAMRRLYSFLMRAETEVVLVLAGDAESGFESDRLVRLVSRLNSVRRHLRFHDAKSAEVFDRLCSDRRAIRRISSGS